MEGRERRPQDRLKKDEGLMAEELTDNGNSVWNGDSPLRTIRFRPLPRLRAERDVRPLKTIRIAPPRRRNDSPLTTIHIAPPPRPIVGAVAEAV